MAQVISFEQFRPIARYDEIPWTQARIEEGETADGPWVTLETIVLDPVDSDPANPAYRNLTTELADDAFDLWYRITFIDGTGDISLPTTPIQNTDPSDTATYATISEIARLLKINSPSDAQTQAMLRVLMMATGEINSEVDRSTDDDDLAGWQLALVEEVCLERAVELWRETPFGLVGIDSDLGATHTARNTWERYAHKLAPIKTQWGLA